MEKEVLKMPSSDRVRAIQRGRLPAVLNSMSTWSAGRMGMPQGSEFRVRASWR